VIYEQRREIMQATGIEELVGDMRADVVYDIVTRSVPEGSYPEQWDIETLKSGLQNILNLDLPIDQWAKEEGIDEAIVEQRTLDAADKFMAEKVARTGPEIFRRVEKAIVLQRLDHVWKEHLLMLDHLRQGINLRAFGQRDPLNEYKAEAFGLFQTMLGSLREGVTQTLSFVEVDPTLGTMNLIPRVSTKTVEVHEEATSPMTDNDAPMARGEMPVRLPTKKTIFNENDPSTWNALPRNAVCPCGSGKKYKHCHGKLSANG